MPSPTNEIAVLDSLSNLAATAIANSAVNLSGLVAGPGVGGPMMATLAGCTLFVVGLRHVENLGRTVCS
jgi:hypothetical protein